MDRASVVIVGAGPAGLAAAAEASQAGASVVVIDEYRGPGGQFFRARRPGVGEPGRVAPKVRQRKEELLKELVADRVRFLHETTVWGHFDDRVLALYRGGKTFHLSYDRLIVASGAYDRPVAFPGWTLPGVITVGAAQTLVKGYGVLPGRRILLAGSGPFLLPVAEELAAAGAQVVGVLEATRPSQWLGRGITRLWGHWERLQEGLHYYRTLRRAGIPYRFGYAVKEARGNGKVEEAVVVQVDGDWRPIPGTEQVEKVDTVCIGYGFLPSTELTRQIGCDHRFDDLRGGWLPVYNEEMRTSVPEVLVAGEVAGIGGAYVAMYQGRIAGVVAARDLGFIDQRAAASKLAALRPVLERHRTFVDAMLEMFAFRPGILDLITDDTLICRCEEVPAARLHEKLTDWSSDLRTYKGVVRPGMGYCQGRICGRLMAGLIARRTNTPEEKLGMLTARPPIKPVPLSAFMDSASAADHQGVSSERVPPQARKGR